jgi:alkanesulfonate monooxygenase SsuD/methylene tetrahydromethanopterin reductase-like flavin-dependent oxidoreductase (luciferase family)
MAAMALNTTKVKLGTGVTNPLTRHPSVSASGYATLEEYAPGRMIVGIGLGDSSVETMGMKPSTLANFEKSLEQMRQILDGKEAELPTGRIHLLHPTKTRVPIYIAASGPKMLELSGRIADGIIVLVGVAASGQVPACELQVIPRGAGDAGDATGATESCAQPPAAIATDKANRADSAVLIFAPPSERWGTCSVYTPGRRAYGSKPGFDDTAAARPISRQQWLPLCFALHFSGEHHDHRLREARRLLSGQGVRPCRWHHGR